MGEMDGIRGIKYKLDYPSTFKYLHDCHSVNFIIKGQRMLLERSIEIINVEKWDFD